VRSRFILLLKILLVLAVALTSWRLSVPSLRTSPEALNSFNSKVSQLREAHRRGLPMQARFSDIELNSDIEDWYKRMHIDVGWPPWGTVLQFKGNRAHAFIPGYMPGNIRVILVDVALNPRDKTLYLSPSVVWIGIAPIPWRLFE
jgi:hypothetical protein